MQVHAVSEFGGKKPETREEFIRLLNVAMKKEMEVRKTRKPTIAGTAKALGIHRDTLYEWMREFGVKFEDVGRIEPTLPAA